MINKNLIFAFKRQSSGLYFVYYHKYLAASYRTGSQPELYP